jgi:hypothetical protein
MQNGSRSTSIVTALLLLLVFPVSGLADGGGPAGPTGGRALGKTTATVVGDAVQFRPCSFEVTFAASDPDNNFSLFQKASGEFPTYHTIRGNTLSGDPALSGDSSTCDIAVWTSTVHAVDDGGLSGETSDPLVLECRKDRDDIPTDPIFSIRPRFAGAGRPQPTATAGFIGCCFNVKLSSSTPGGGRDLYFEMVSGNLPPGHYLSGDEIIGCSTITSISGSTSAANDVYVPPSWTSKWRARNKKNRCEISGISTLTLTCDQDF